MKKSKKYLNISSLGETEIIAREDKPKKNTSNGFSLAQAADIGFAIAIPISSGALLGVFLDQKFNTQPKMTLSLLFGGIIIAFASLFRLVRDFSKKD